MDPCILVKTGTNILPLILLAVFLIASLSSVAFYGRKTPISLLGFVLLFSLSLGFTSLAPSVSAQSLPPECIESDEDHGDGEVLGLVDDIGNILMPSEDNPFTTINISILANDNPPDGDPYNWETIDLDVNTPGQQTMIDFIYEDEHPYICGWAEVISFGVISINLEYDCWAWVEEDLDTYYIDFPSDFTIPPFQYTVRTINQIDPPTPATVRIYTHDVLPAATVFAKDDYEEYFFEFQSGTIDILANDSTSAGTLDPTTIDLDPITAGIQSSITFIHEGVSFDAFINQNGLLEVSTTDGSDFYNNLPILVYTVQNTNGDTSNIAMINIWVSSLIPPG